MPPMMIDVSGLASVIQTVITKAMDPLVKAIQRDESKSDLLGMRDQILSNIEILWPMVQPLEPNDSEEEPEPEPESMPDFRVIISGKNNAFNAQVVYDADMCAEKFVFVKGGNAASAEKAMTRLLEATMSMLDKYQEDNIVTPSDGKWMTTKGGTYYQFGRV